ncbi:MAG: hypothetical protein K6E19_11180, partial [Lachnospiraceae bacterium]|nr:hypothetical protein [Lachnospiraceae bacterium]
ANAGGNSVNDNGQKNAGTENSTINSDFMNAVSAVTDNGGTEENTKAYEDSEGDGNTPSEESSNPGSSENPQGVDVTPVQADWEGTYIVDYDYEGKYGAIKCAVTDNGLIHVTINLAEMQIEVDCTEENFDKAEYVYGTYVTADAKPYEGYTTSSFELKLKTEPDEPAKLEFSFGGYPKEGDEWISVRKELKKFTPWHEKPEGYEDKDIDGFISALDLTDEKVKPATDDYVIFYQDMIGSWNGTDYDYYVRYTVYSFDENGMLVKQSMKEVYEKEELAKKRYDEENKYNPRLSLAGNVLYEEGNPELYEYSSKAEAVEIATRKWYTGCHYAYSESYGDEWGHSYCYMRKPFDEEIFSLDADAAVYWKPIGSTAHSFRSKDVQDVTFGGDVSEYDSVRLFIWGKYPDDYLSQFYNDSFIRFQGMSATSCSYASAYQNSGDGKDYYVIFRDYSFGKEETEVTEYVFKVENFTDHGITFDNFRDKTPDHTWTQHFDMTREAD